MSDERRGFVPREEGLRIRPIDEPGLGQVWRKNVPGGIEVKVRELSIDTVVGVGPMGLSIAFPMNEFLNEYRRVPDPPREAAPMPELSNTGRASSLATQPGVMAHVAPENPHDTVGLLGAQVNREISQAKEAIENQKARMTPIPGQPFAKPLADERDERIMRQQDERNKAAQGYGSGSSAGYAPVRPLIGAIIAKLTAAALAPHSSGQRNQLLIAQELLACEIEKLEGTR